MTRGEEKKRFVIERHSPYCLYPFEGPKVLIMVVVFDGKNFDLWERAMRVVFKSKARAGVHYKTPA